MQGARVEPLVKEQAACATRSCRSSSSSAACARQLATGSLVTGQRYVALAYFPKAPQGRVDWSADAAGAADRHEHAARARGEARQHHRQAGAGAARRHRRGCEEGARRRSTQTLAEARGMIKRFDAESMPALKTALDDARGALGAAEKMLTQHRGQPRRRRAPGPGRAAQRDAGARARRAQPARARRLSRAPSRGAHPRQERGAAEVKSLRHLLTVAALALAASAPAHAGRRASTR